MALQINPGNILPVYNKKEWQRHRWEGCDNTAFGLPCPNVRLIPFQFPTTESLVTVTIDLMDMDDVSQLSITSFEMRCTASVNYVTYKGGTLSIPVDTGHYYYKIVAGDETYYSDVMHCKPMSLGDEITIYIDSCINAGPGQATFNLLGGGTVGCTIESDSIDMWNLTNWQTLSGGVLNTSAPYVDLRRVVTLSAGWSLTVYYRIAWGGSDCATATMTVTGHDNSEGTNGYWKITGTNTNDKEGVLYQTGYIQEIWIKPTFAPIEVARNEAPNVDGEGNEVVGSSRTVEVWKFEAPRLPDYTIFPLTIFRDLDTVTLTGMTVDDVIPMTNYKFDNDLDGACLNIGLFSFDNAIEVYSGCDEDKSLVTCT